MKRYKCLYVSLFIYFQTNTLKNKQSYHNNIIQTNKQTNKQKILKNGVSVQLFPAPMLRFLSALTQTVSE